MSKKKKEEEIQYVLTLKGLLITMVSEEKADEICDQMELQGYRRGLRTPAVVLEDRVWSFVEVERVEEY